MRSPVPEQKNSDSNSISNKMADEEVQTCKDWQLWHVNLATPWQTKVIVKLRYLKQTVRSKKSWLLLGAAGLHVSLQGFQGLSSTRWRELYALTGYQIGGNAQCHQTQINKFRNHFILKDTPFFFFDFDFELSFVYQLIVDSSWTEEII